MLGTATAGVVLRQPAHQSQYVPSSALSYAVQGERLRRDLIGLSAFGRNPEGGVSRLGFSPEDMAGRSFVIGLMKEAGLVVEIDNAGNIHGKRAGSENLKPILFGSHIDSVPKGGNFDGDVGSLAAIEVIRALNERQGTTRHPLETIVFSNEEGVHYGSGLFGSRAMIGTLKDGEIDRPDQSGLTIRDWLKRYGADPEHIASAIRDKDSYHAYVELHIEQGAQLFDSRVPIGVVQGIVGIERFDCKVTGFANHAGTTPMRKRKDALVAASEIILVVRELTLALEGRQVGTVGALTVTPGAPNVIPGTVEFPIELRDLNSAKIDRLIGQIRSRAAAIAQRSGMQVDIQHFSGHAPAMMDMSVQDIIAGAASAAGLPSARMPSGAGHDAQSMAAITRAGMIFVPSVDGISHSPLEKTEWQDCANGAEVLYRTVLALDRL